MAKMFYNIDEVQAKLGATRDQIKQMIDGGKLRRFYDGSKEMFKVDEVDKLASAGKPGDSEIMLAPEDSGEAPGLSLASEPEDRGLAPVDGDSELGLVPFESGSMAGIAADDTAVKESPKESKGSDESDGSIGLIPLSETSDQIKIDDTGDNEATKDDTVLTSHGVNILEDSDSEKALAADPLAQTQIAPDFADQVQLDSGSSGSGLLDLTREADDTSLGAELLEEIYPGADQEGSIETQVPSSMGMIGSESSSIIMDSQAEPLVSYAKVVEVYDPTSAAYGMALVVPLVFLFYLACATGAGAMGVLPKLMAQLSQYNLYVLGGGILLTVGVLFTGLMVTRPSAGPAKPKARKAKPEKVKKEKPEKKAKK